MHTHGNLAAFQHEGAQHSSWQWAGTHLTCLASLACRTVGTGLRHGSAGGSAMRSGGMLPQDTGREGCEDCRQNWELTIEALHPVPQMCWGGSG